MIDMQLSPDGLDSQLESQLSETASIAQPL